MKLKFINACILINENNVDFLFGDVVVTDNIITYVGEKIENDENNYDRIIDVNNNILMPGFVNCHCHTPMSILRGIGSDCNLDKWLFDNMIPIEQKMTDNDIYFAELLGIAEYVKAGVTCFEEGYAHTKAMIDAIRKAKIRARINIGDRQIGKEDQFTLTELYQNDLDLIKNDELITPVVFIHSIYTNTEDKICEAIEFTAKNNLPRSIHLSETLKEVGDCDVKNGCSPVEYLEKLGYFDRPCTCYHCVHCDKDDLQILADYNVSVVTCPASNLKLGSGIAPIYAMQNKGINIAIGTDGVASNNNIDMFKEMYLTAVLQKANLYDASILKANEVLDMATKNGSIALGIKKIGSIKEGYFADLILIDTKKPHFYPRNDLLAHLVYSANCNDVYFTMCNGNILYENGEFNIGEDINKIYTECEKNIKRLKEEVK